MNTSEGCEGYVKEVDTHGYLLRFLFLIVLLGMMSQPLAPLFAEGDKTMNSELPVKKTIVVTSPGKDHLVAVVRFENVSTFDVFILKEGPPLFVSVGTSDIENMGPSEKRKPYTLADYERLSPGQSTERRQEIFAAFAWLPGTHTYDISISGNYEDPVNHKMWNSSRVITQFVWVGSQKSTNTPDFDSDKKKAVALVRSYGRHLGATVTELDADNDYSFGESGLHYDALRGMLTGRVFIVKLDSDLMKPELVERAKHAMEELNGPKIAPLFERVGGRFEFEPAKDILFLKKDFPVQSTSERQLREQMDELSDVGAKWVFRWYGWAMQILYGRAQPPGAPVPVTRANDAQHTEFKR